MSAAQAVSQGLPVKVVALYQTKAPMGVISFPDVPLKSPKDLEGKRLAISVGETFGDMLGPFTRINNVDIGKIQQIQMDASARTSQFLTRKIDVMSVYLSNEWPQIEKRANVKFNVLRVSDFGLNLLGASIIVEQRICCAKSGNGQEASTRDRQGLPRRHGRSEGSRQGDGQVHEGSRRSRGPRPASRSHRRLDQCAAGQTDRLAGGADWQANLTLLKETGGMPEVKPLDAYFTNEYLQ